MGHTGYLATSSYITTDRMYFLKIFLTFLLLFSSSFSDNNECLVSISVPDITASQANISWSYLCDTDNLLSFKIYYDHVEYRACQEDINRGKKHNQKRKKVDGSQLSAIIDKLEPYSTYKFEVAAIPKGESPKIEIKTIQKMTKEGFPSVVLQKKREKNQNAPDKITLMWESPNINDCDKYHSKPKYYVYKARGSSKWNTDFFKEGNLSIRTTDLTISDVLPFSLYKIDLYVASIVGHSSIPALETEILTGPSQPHKPSNLSITDNLLQWAPPYPPTGHIERYQVRWRQVDSEESGWEISDVLTVDEISCPDNLVCHKMQKLEANQEYSLQVRAFNKDVESGSEWSNMVYSLDTDNGINMTLVVIVIIAVTVILFLFLIMVFLVHKFNIWNRLKGFKPTQTDDYTFRPILKGSDSRQSSISRLSSARPVTTSTPLTKFPESASRSPSSEVELRNFTPSHNRASLGRRSCLDPLPPVPGKEEPIYDELVKPPAQPLDEDNYLAPNPVRVASVESLDEEGYLRPNFNRLQLLDTRSPDRESLPPIPPVSYSSQDQLQS